MGLIYVERRNANLEDIAALLRSHKSDTKRDNDADLLPGRGTDFAGSCDHQISHLCFDTDNDSGFGGGPRGPTRVALQEREGHTHGKNKSAIRAPPVNMSSARRAGDALPKSR